jgi:hypothetical protein
LNCSAIEEGGEEEENKTRYTAKFVEMNEKFGKVK